MSSQKAPKIQEISYLEIANFFLVFANETGEVVTNLKLQKLIYYAQAWYLANFKSPLFKEDFQAWVHGPVVPELYQMFKEKGSMPIATKLKAEDIETQIDKDTLTFLKEVAKLYMPFGAYELEMMTHQEYPWKIARGDCRPDQVCKNIIAKSTMQKYYAEKISNKSK